MTNLNIQWVIFDIYYMLNICLQQISCNFYIHFQIRFEFYQYNGSTRVSLQR